MTVCVCVCVWSDRPRQAGPFRTAQLSSPSPPRGAERLSQGGCGERGGRVGWGVMGRGGVCVGCGGQREYPHDAMMMGHIRSLLISVRRGSSAVR